MTPSMFIRISLELSPLATLLFINNYWNLTRGNFYCVLLIVFQFLNLTTADSISEMFAWAVAYILIGSIHYRYQLANAMNIDGVSGSEIKELEDYQQHTIEISSRQIPIVIDEQQCCERRKFQ